VISRPRPTLRLTSVAAAIGLLGACAVLVALVEAPGTAAPARRAGAARGASSRGAGPDGTGHDEASPAARPPRSAGMSPAALTWSTRTGLRLMTQAAAACQALAFRGEQITAWWGPTDESVADIQVWHRPGGAVVAESDLTEGNEAGEQQPGQDASPDADDVMTVTPALLRLMQANYAISYGGRTSVDGRPAQLVLVRRAGGRLAARFWLDAATSLPLRRELYDASGVLFSEDVFVTFGTGASQLRGMPAVAAQPWAGQLSAPGRAALRAQGWPLPGAEVNGLRLFKSAQTGTRADKIVELSYSDGLSVISVFVQRGELPRSMPGWRRVTAHGASPVYAIDPDDRSLTWPASGYVYTMISDAASGTVAATVMRLPHASAPGFWERIGRGFKRIGSWANPLH
jgi:sigma-E factor negative regulatory protein RseB